MDRPWLQSGALRSALLSSTGGATRGVVPLRAHVQLHVSEGTSGPGHSGNSSSLAGDGGHGSSPISADSEQLSTAGAASASEVDSPWLQSGALRSALLSSTGGATRGVVLLRAQMLSHEREGSTTPGHRAKSLSRAFAGDLGSSAITAPGLERRALLPVTSCRGRSPRGPARTKRPPV